MIENTKFSLKNKVAVITGGAGLLGVQHAKAIAEDGGIPILWDINAEASSKEAAKIARDYNIFSSGIMVDITNQESIKQAFDQVLDTVGRIDILINNAAAARGEDRVPIVDLPDDVFRKVNDIKVFGTYLCTKAVVKVLKEQGQGGKIVNISSTAGKSGSPNTLAYNAANFAVVGMTQSMARELGPLGINVNCVCPGFTETSRMDGLDLGQGADKTAIGRIGTDDEVGDFIAHLCTKATSWITGQSINVNGGSIVEH